MDSSPRRWVLRPLSPSLQPSDLRSISARDEDEVFYSNISAVDGQSSGYMQSDSKSWVDMTMTAQQVSLSQDGSSSSDELPISPCSSTAGSHSGFYSFVEDPLSPEAEQNEAWMVSPQRQSHLATLKQQNVYKLQTYSSHKKPGSLFPDDTDSQYEITPRYGYKVVREEEERQLRKEIIRGQAPKKSPVAEKVSDSLMNETSRLIEGFSISFSHVSPKPKPTIDSDAIDEEQINFNAARKQFVQMEQNKIDPIIRPHKIQVKTSAKLNQDATVLYKEVRREELVFKPSMEDVVDVEVKEDQNGSHSQQSSYLKDSDGLSIDGLAHKQNQTVNNIFQFNVEPETPIEREIRVAQEREENLRRSRGLQSSVSEMVEIKTKRFQLPTPLTPSRAKEKGKTSFIFQEIQRKEEAIKQDAATQELAGPRLERANSYDILQSNANEDRTSFIFHEIQRKEEAIKQDGITREFAGPKRVRAYSYDILQSKANANEGNGIPVNQEYGVTNASKQKAKLDVVDYALQKQNYTAQGESKIDDRQSYTIQRYSYTKQNDQGLARNGELEGFKSFEERWQNLNGDKMENGFKSISIERSGVHSFSEDVLPLPCCPHKHPEDSDPTQQEQRRHSPQTPVWKDSLERTGVHTRGQGGSLLIERDIEEALRREQELREQREARVRQMYVPQTLVQQADKMGTSEFIKWDIEEAVRREQELREQREARVRQVYSPQTLVQQTEKMAATQFYPQIKTGKAESRVHSYSRPSLSVARPWSPAPQTPLSPFRNLTQTTAPHGPQSPSPTDVRVPPSVRGLTQTLLQNFEERRSKLKLDESAYAGIQPVDSVNNEVVESTRVARHKNQRALQWEAGLFANQQDQ